MTSSLHTYRITYTTLAPPEKGGSYYWAIEAPIYEAYLHAYDIADASSQFREKYSQHSLSITKVDPETGEDL